MFQRNTGDKSKAMRIGYYPGCSLTSSAREYDESVRQSARRST